MATLVLTTVGTLVGGPVGGAIGAVLGQAMHQRLYAPKAPTEEQERAFTRVWTDIKSSS